MIEWGKIGCLGVKEMDEEHQIFFDLVERASKLLDQNPTTDDICLLIAELKDYTENHFIAEEKLMQTMHYPEFHKHQMEHILFSSQIEAINTSIIEQNSKAYLVNMIDFIVQWTILHMDQYDIELAKYYLENQATK